MEKLSRKKILKMIPRFKNGSINAVKFNDVGFWKNYRVNIENYLTKDDKVELCKHSIKTIENDYKPISKLSTRLKNNYLKMKKVVKNNEERLLEFYH